MIHDHVAIDESGPASTPRQDGAFAPEMVASAPASSNAAAADPHSRLDNFPVTAPAERSISRVAWAGALITVLIACAAVLGSWSDKIELPAEPRIAVMMFDNQSPDPANAFFAEGLHSEIVTTLAKRIPGLQVVSRNTMRMHQNSGKSSPAIAEELAATHILEGAVLRDGNRMRLTLQLIDGRTDKLVWSERYERTLADALQLQADIAGGIADLLLIQLVGAIDTPTTDAVAYDLYLKARVAKFRLNGSYPVEEWRRIETLLGEAIERDPDFWLAYLERASIRRYIEQAAYPGTSGSTALAVVDLAVAQRIAGDEPAILIEQALAEPDTQLALEIFESAESLGVIEPELLWAKANLLVRARRWPEALQLYDRLSYQDPGNIASIGIAWAHFQNAREGKKAYQMMDYLLKRDPENFQVRRQRAQTIFAFTGDMDEWMASSFNDANRPVDEGTRAFELWKQLRFGARYAELKSYFDTFAAETFRNLSIGPFRVPSMAETPAAVFSGWADMLLGNATDALDDSVVILNYVERRRTTVEDEWYVSLLAAEGHLFAENGPAAIAATYEALSQAALLNNDLLLAAARTEAAQIFAWAGAEDEAVAVLELLADGVPGLPPALVTRDPLFNIPLADNQRYLRLRDRLELVMAAQQFE